MVIILKQHSPLISQLKRIQTIFKILYAKDQPFSWIKMCIIALSLQPAKMKLCSVLLVCFPFEEVHSLQKNSCDPASLVKYNPTLQRFWFSFICSQIPFNSHMFYCCVVFYLLSRDANTNRSFRMWHLLHLGSFSITRTAFRLVSHYCDVSLADTNNKGLCLRENLQSLDIICQKITLSPYTLGFSM